MSISSSILSAVKKNMFVLHDFLTKSRLILKQFTTISITQLERCKIPPSKLTTDFILSVVDDLKNVMFI
jgi:hypothetical protein